MTVPRGVNDQTACMSATEAASTTDSAPIDGFDPTGAGAREEVTRRYIRSPEDVLRLVGFAVTSLVLIGITIWLEDAVVGVEEDIIELFGFLSPSIERVLHGGIEIVSGLVIVMVYLIPLVVRRYRLFGYILLSSAVAGLVMQGVRWLIDRETSTSVLNELAQRAGITSSVPSGAIAISQTAAMFIVVAPFVTRRWRRAGAITITILLLLRLLVSVRLPAEAFVALPIGALCGTAVLLAFGRPDRRPTTTAIQTALAEAGLPVTEVHAASVDARGSTPYFATLPDGTGLFVKVLGAQERSADLLFRVYRFLRFKNVGDDRPFSSLRRTIEHEALIALLARDVGIRTPRLRGIVDVGADSMLLAYEMIDGSSLDGVPDERVTDELMRSIWEQIGDLRAHRIAHRDLRRANVFVGADQVPWVIDFGFSEVAVPETILDADVAGLLKELQEEVIERCGVEQVEFVALERASRNTIITIVALVLATYFLFPQLADLPGIVDQVREANWGWTPLIILASTVTYLAATMSIAGSIPPRLPAGPLFMASVGSSFASKLAPAGLGGMALNVRFLQKQGVAQPVAVSGVGLNTIAGLVGHVSLVGIFLIWAGRDAFGSFSLPDLHWFLIGIGIVLLLIALTMVIPATRRMVFDKLLPIIAKAFDGVTDVLRRPGKMTMLIGGSALVTFSYLTTLYFSIAAFGGGLPFATVGAVFLVGSAVAQAAPTPGGLGAMEAALISGLVAAGLDSTVAVPAVFLYRLFTFWVPILPGWLSFQWLQRHDYL